MKHVRSRYKIMRKITFFVTSCIATVALMGLSTSAFALTDPDCDGDPYNNDAVIHQFDMDTPDSDGMYQASSVVGSALACGSEISWFGAGADTLYDYAYIEVANRVRITDTSNIPVGSYAGTATVSVLVHIVGSPNLFEDQVSTLTVDRPANGDCPANSVACYKGENSLGHNWSWATRDANGKYTLTIGPMHGISGTEPGLTRIQMELCKNFGAVGDSECGLNSDPVVQKNGARSIPNCDNGNGWYDVTAEQRGGFTTPSVNTCVEWQWPRVPVKPVQHSGATIKPLCMKAKENECK